MKAKRGQVAIYLVLVLTALTFLVMMNVGAYLAVTAKNRAMNAGDSAALAAAAHQGSLLEKIGRLNLEHLKTLGDANLSVAEKQRRTEEIAAEQAYLAFIGPIDGIRLASDAARKVGAKDCGGMQRLLAEHVNEIRTAYAETPELYPEPWKDAWEAYAAALELAIGGGIVAGPDNIDFRNAASGHYLTNKSFYNAVDGRSWCWFYFNAMSLLENYSSYTDWAPLPTPDEETRLRTCANCEIFSLHLVSKTGSALDVLGRDLIRHLTDWTDEEIAAKPMLKDDEQVWYFFDESEWREWWEIDPDGKWKFPVVGRMKDEYNVKGCAAICRVYENIPDLVADKDDREIQWSAAAKPFAVSTDERGAAAPINYWRNFVVPAEWDTRLVPVDTVGGKDLSTADYVWMEHVKNHLPAYMENGTRAFTGGCAYCGSLVEWEREELRRQGLEWLKTSSDSCVRCAPGGTPEVGGTPHGH